LRNRPTLPASSHEGHFSKLPVSRSPATSHTHQRPGGQSHSYPEFKGNVATVYSHPLSKGGSSGAHYGGNAETYMNVGEAMGRAMAELLSEKNE
jgi:hypothetical protein